MRPPHRFTPPKDLYGLGKPSHALYTSQVPLLEKSPGEPHVYTVDIRNPAEVNSALDRIEAHGPVQPYIHPDFTVPTFVARVQHIVETLGAGAS